MNTLSLIRKGHALCELGRHFEAMDCYSKAIKSDQHDFRVLCYRAYLFNEMGQDTDAMQDFNKAYEFVYRYINLSKALNDHQHKYSTRRFDGELIQETLELIKMLSKLQESAIEFKNELQKLRDACLCYPEVQKEVEEKEAIAKEQHLKLLKRAVENINLGYNSFGTILQIKNEVTELQREKNDIAIQLWLLLPIQQ